MCCFKQKTAYERRSSDWSSDVCSAYLGGLSSAGVHNRSMPARVSPISVARPEQMMIAISSQLVGVMIAGPNSASMMANLAMKPDSGGRPDSNSVQKMKPPPRIANVPGMTMPVSSSSDRKSVG